MAFVELRAVMSEFEPLAAVPKAVLAAAAVVEPVPPLAIEIGVAIAKAWLNHVVPLEVRTFPEVPGATKVGELAPLPIITLLAVRVLRPVPPSDTGRSVVNPVREVISEFAPEAAVPKELLAAEALIAPVPPLVTGTGPPTPPGGSCEGPVKANALKARVPKNNTANSMNPILYPRTRDSFLSFGVFVFMFMINIILLIV